MHTKISDSVCNGLKSSQSSDPHLFNISNSVLFFERIHPNLRSTVYCSAIATGGAEEWDFGWRMFKNATIAIEADKLMSSLACAKDHVLLERFAR